MRIISILPLKEFWQIHPPAEIPLRDWIKKTKAAIWKNFAEVRRTFNSADTAGICVVFNIGGNKYRLIVTISYNKQKVYVRHILTHADYDQNGWKEGCSCP